MSPARYAAPLTRDEEDEFLPFMRQLVLEAFAQIQPRFLSGLAVDTKSDLSPVTEADRQTEAHLRELIIQRYPGHGIVGEEHGVREGVRYRWVLDPIDGTKAFISHCFLFGSLIALERDDGAGYRPVLGAIAHAAADLFLIGHAGETRLFHHGNPVRTVRVRAARTLNESTLLATTAPGSPEQGAKPAVGRLFSAAKLARTWGDCFGYFSLATGGADIMIDPVLSYWDVAAVVPVLEGAGACLSGWNGGNPLQEVSLIATTDPRLHDEVLAMVRRD